MSLPIHSQISEIPVEGKRVLVRVDFNVPMDQGKITDDTRIRAALPTIEYLLKRNAALVLMSHLGRPKGKDLKLSLAPVAQRLSEILGKPVIMARDIEKIPLKPREICMLENLRFHKEEEEPTEEFVKALASLGDVYINEAFGTAHRAHASTSEIARHFPGKKAPGFLMEKEIQALSPLRENPERPFHVIIGGAKISTKAGVIQNLKVDELYIGGAMAFPFFKAKGISVGDFPVSEEDIQIAKEILKQKRLHLPVDLVISKDSEMKIISVQEGVPTGWNVGDIGPQTVLCWSKSLADAKTIFWNGPLGIVEKKEFTAGTKAIAEILAQSKAKVTIGGGDSVAAIQQMGLANKFFHLSTGGGASLEFLEFGHLPGIDALT